MLSLCLSQEKLTCMVKKSAQLSSLQTVLQAEDWYTLSGSGVLFATGTILKARDCALNNSFACFLWAQEEQRNGKIQLQASIFSKFALVLCLTILSEKQHVKCILLILWISKTVYPRAHMADKKLSFRRKGKNIKHINSLVSLVCPFLPCPVTLNISTIKLPMNDLIT